MTSKYIVLFIAAVFVQSIAANRVRSCGSIAISENGGPFVATSLGPTTPSGISVATDLALNGDLVVDGALPFLTAVAFEGSYPTSGSAAVSYGCGDGVIAITQEIGNPGGSNAVSDSGLGINSLGIGSCGCRRI